MTSDESLTRTADPIDRPTSLHHSILHNTIEMNPDSTMLPDWGSPFPSNLNFSEGFSPLLIPDIGLGSRMHPAIEMNDIGISGSLIYSQNTPSRSTPEMTSSSSVVSSLPSPTLFGDGNIHLLELQDSFHMTTDRLLSIQRADLPKTYPERLEAIYPSLKIGDRDLPTGSAFKRYVNLFFDHFNPHLPMLHRPSFNIEETSTPLVLSVTSIGALYAAEHMASWNLHCMSKNILNHIERATLYVRGEDPLWCLQASLLNVIYAAWTGDSRSRKYTGIVQNSLTGKILNLCSHLEPLEEILRQPIEQICEYEQKKRLFFAMYTVSTTFSCAFGDNPTFFNHDCSIMKMPCGDEEWGLSLSSAENQSKLITSIRIQPTFKSALSSLSSLSSGQPSISPFSLRVLINAMRLETWQMQRAGFADPDFVSDVWQDKLTEKLEGWYSLFDQAKQKYDSNSCQSLFGSPQVLPNVLVLYHYNQVERYQSLRNLSLHLKAYESPPELVATWIWELQSDFSLSPDLTSCMRHCFECVSSFMSTGIYFTARTAPLHYNADFACLASLLCLVLSTWLARFSTDDGIEPGSAEDVLITDTSNMLRDAGYRPKRHNIAQTLNGAWAHIWGQNWVWRVTSRYAKVFSAYQTFLQQK